MASISASSASAGVQSAAAALALTCSALVAPAITDEQPLDLGQLLLGHVALAGGQPGPGRYLLPLPDLAGQQAVGEREIRQYPQAEVRGRRDDLRLGLAFEQ